jgi:NADP-dependent 3-hydroxy acid dehydrogenase YdfG
MLAERGWSVIVSSRRAENVEEAGGRIALDVSKADEVEAAVKKILAAHGRIDLLVNSAGINVRHHRNWADFTREGWDQVIGINLNGLLYRMRAVLPATRSRKEGTIVNFSSWAGKFASPLTGPAYSASKHAVVAPTHEFNRENFRDNLRACCICPGEVATPILKSRPVPPSDEDMARVLRAEDVASAIVYVAESPQRVCLNEIVISPTWNRIFLASPAP